MKSAVGLLASVAKRKNLLLAAGLSAALMSPTNIQAEAPPAGQTGTSPKNADGPDPDAIVLRSRVFDIPFQMDGSSKAKVVTLFVSSDRGQTWKPADRRPIPIEKFHFEASEDGDYWFTHATDLDAISDPSSQLSAERKIRIDTTGPKIELSGSANLEGLLVCTLALADPHRVGSLRILYATDVVREWATIPNQIVDAAGQFKVYPKVDWQQISVHVTATDTLGNVSVTNKTFRRPRIANLENSRCATNQAPQPEAKPVAMPIRETMPTASEKPSTNGMPKSSQLAAAGPENQLRVQAAAGPADPPSYLLGPSQRGASASGTRSALQSPGSGPLRSPNQTQLPGSSAFRPGFNSKPRAGAATGMPFRAPQSSAAQGSMNTRSSIRAQGNTGRPSVITGTNDRRPQTLPASGVTAKVTPEGIEVLPPPDPEPELAAPNAERNKPANASGNDSAKEYETLPFPRGVPSQDVGPQLNAPQSGSQPSRAPGDPITESVPTPHGRSAPPPEPERPRTLKEAIRPLESNRPHVDAPMTSRGAAEEIPTPRPSEVDSAQRYRAERAEQAERAVTEQQRRFDLSQLSRNVPYRFSNSIRFSLDYELEAVGATGVEAVELFGSLDGGQTWKRWGADPDRTSPFDIETKGEGVFSFRIVVLGNNGLASPRPLPGDQPDIAVVVDETLPQIKITSARYGEGDRTGSLVIRYDCRDEHLGSRPVAIAFSDSLEGPWTTIAAGLRNDGLYVWPADPKLPPAIYLRIDATDRSGNVGNYILDQPIATGGLAPRARILGFRSR